MMQLMKPTYQKKMWPHTIYECDGAGHMCHRASLHSLRMQASQVQDLVSQLFLKTLKCGDVMHYTASGQDDTVQSLTVHHTSSSRAGAGCHTQKKDRSRHREQIAYYMNNAKTIREGLAVSRILLLSGGVNAPYIWLKTPDKMTSWEFFDYLLDKANVVGTPGSGFGPSGEGYFRLTSFGSYENTLEAVERIKKLK